MNDDIRDHRVTAALAYAPLLFFVTMRKKESAFCQFHAKQGIALFVAWILVSFFAWIPILGWLAFLSMIVINLLAVARTLDGQSWELPILGKYAAKIKL